MLADNRLGLIRIKIKRANKHIDDLEDAVRDFVQPIGKTISFNRDPQAGNVGLQFSDVYVYKSDIPAIAGDAVHNLRSALDHLAFQLAEVGIARGERPVEKWEEIQFPIGHGPDGYKSIKPRRVQGMTREAIEAIDALKPYKGGNEALWLLRHLDNADKHNFIITAGSDFIIDGMALKNDEPFFTVLDIADDQQDVNLSLDESVVQMRIRNSNALLPTLHQLSQFVSSIVTAFAPLLNDGTPQATSSRASDL
jgi:hypothetical protein